MRDSLLLALLLTAVAAAFGVRGAHAAQIAAVPMRVHVSPNTAGGGDGSLRRPFSSIPEALQHVRPARGKGGTSRPAEILLAAGAYPITSTLALEARDSHLTIRPEPGASVTLTGGRTISNWKPVSDPAVRGRLGTNAAHVVEADLKAVGITDFGSLSRRGFGIGSRPAHLELFFNGQPMQIARWPNGDWARIRDVPDGKDSGRFTYDGDRPSAWAGQEDVWLHGFWTWDWADSYEKVRRIDPTTRTIETESPHGVYGYKAGARFYALNVLEELDSPGEHYLDRRTGRLYFWPPSHGKSWHTQVSLLEQPMITITGARGVTIHGLTLECSRGSAVVITGGAGNTVQDCIIRNLGNAGVIVGERSEDYQTALYGDPTLDRQGGSGNGVRGCEILNVGDSAVVVGGGDRKTLRPGGNFVEDCHLHHFSRWSRTYRPGVAIDGVGNRIVHNHIHDAPHSAILLHGNDHLVAYNNIHHVCMDTNDAGAFYLGRDFTERGNRVICNYFHHLGAAPWVHAVYMDDCASGTTLRGNVFYKAGASVFIGGGRDNTVENNIFVKCRPGMRVDARGMGWASFWFDGKDSTLMDRLKAVRHDQPPYSTRYPGLTNILNDEPAAPKGNRLVRNVCFDGGCIEPMNNLTADTVLMKDNWMEGDPGFARPLPEDPKPGDFLLDPGSPVWQLGFQAIPVERIMQ